MSWRTRFERFRRSAGAKSVGVGSAGGKSAGSRFLAAGLLTTCAIGCPANDPLSGEAPTTIENPIVVENRKPGNPPSEWDIRLTDRPGISGFATEMSVLPGADVHFKVRSWSAPYIIDIYRVGYYAGDGARKLDSIEPFENGKQPPCKYTPERGLLDCGNWFESAVWRVPDDAVSGVYFAKLIRRDSVNERSNHILFVVRTARPSSDLLFQTSDTTWQAYNAWSDAPESKHSLYRGPDGDLRGATKAVKVSYNRPLEIGKTKKVPVQHFLDGRHGFFAAEYPMIRFLERNGYDVAYQSGADTARSAEDLLQHRVFLSVGHDEYWSQQQRENVTRARDAGVHLAFASGNSVFYKIRWEDDHRTIVCYKGRTPETHELADVWTGEWSNGFARGIAPENALKGTSGANMSDMALAVPAALGRLRFWRETNFAELPEGAVGKSIENLVGYEWERDVDNGYRPAGLIRLSHTPARRAGGEVPGTDHKAHHMTLYRARNRALVFSAGTIQWSWGLDGPDPDHRHVTTGQLDVPADRNIQQAMVNLLVDMGVEPETLQRDLVLSEATNDEIPPSVSFARPEFTATAGEDLVLEGTAGDEGGVVAAVEVEVDGLWHFASGRESFSYRYTATTPGTARVRVRAVDDSGNVSEANAAAATVIKK